MKDAVLSIQTEGSFRSRDLFMVSIAQAHFKMQKYYNKASCHVSKPANNHHEEKKINKKG